MIDESRFWKEDIARWADCVERKLTARRWSERSYATLEKALMLGFFGIRRLVEAGGRISDETAKLGLHLHEYPRASDYMTTLNRHKVDKHFDLNAPKATTRALGELANQFIHSFVLMPVLYEDRGLASVLVCSDWQRHQSCFEIPAQEVISAFRRVAHDYPARVNATYSARKRDFVFQAKP